MGKGRNERNRVVFRDEFKISGKWKESRDWPHLQGDWESSSNLLEEREDSRPVLSITVATSHM